MERRNGSNKCDLELSWVWVECEPTLGEGLSGYWRMSGLWLADTLNLKGFSAAIVKCLRVMSTFTPTRRIGIGGARRKLVFDTVMTFWIGCIRIGFLDMLPSTCKIRRIHSPHFFSGLRCYIWRLPLYINCLQETDWPYFSTSSLFIELQKWKP